MLVGTSRCRGATLGRGTVRCVAGMGGWEGYGNDGGFVVVVLTRVQGGRQIQALDY